MFLFSLLLLSCSQSPTEKGKEIIHRSIEAHGGWETYTQLDTITFKKTTRLFFEDGSVESEKEEAQVYTLSPSYSVFILNDTDYITYDGQQLFASVNDTVLTATEDLVKVEKHLQAAEFVFFQPFKLKDSGAEIVYTGSKTIMDSLTVSEVKVSFPDGKDTWWFYFDNDYRLVANKVLHNERYSLIENLELQEYKSLLFNKHRKSYFVDSLNQKQYLRAEYFYQLEQ